VRRSAAYALGALRARLATPTLIQALGDPDSQVRRNAAWALGRIGDPAALPRLSAIQTEADADNQVVQEAQAAIHAIERSGWHQLSGLVRNWLGHRAGGVPRNGTAG
jgi:HEAT repeat protein